MKVKLIYAFFVALIGIGICSSVWLLLREHGEREFRSQVISALKQRDGRITNRSSIPRPSQNPDGSTRSERTAQRIKNYFTSAYSAEQLATPRLQKWLALLDSPEMLEHLENNSNYREWSEFLKSKGIPVDWDEVFDEIFRDHFPTGIPDDYESEMRLKVAKLFIDAAPVHLTDPKAATLQRINVLVELIEKDKAGLAWFVGRFGQDWDAALQVDPQGVEHNAALVWLIDTQRNAASIVADAETVGVDIPETEASTSSWNMSSVMESFSTSRRETEIPTAFDTKEHASMTDTEIEAEIEKLLTLPPPNIPTNQRSEPPREIQSNLEDSLKEQFSSERIDHAMDTLEQYGREEGLRRLRENDPEVAKRVERYRKREGQDK